MQNTLTFTFQYSLQDAALLAANDHPVPLGFAAEAGVNTYAQISLPSLLHKVHLFLCLPVFLICKRRSTTLVPRPRPNNGKLGRAWERGLHGREGWQRLASFSDRLGPRLASS